MFAVYIKVVEFEAEIFLYCHYYRYILCKHGARLKSIKDDPVTKALISRFSS